MLLTFPGTQRARQHLLLRQSVRAWGDCLPMHASDWLDGDCARILLRSMALDWFCDSGRHGREWLCAIGSGLDAWRNIAGQKEAMVRLPGSSAVMGVVNGLPRIKPNMGVQDEDPEEPVIRLGMRQWEDAMGAVPDQHIDLIARQAHDLANGSPGTVIVEQGAQLNVPAAMALASVALMGVAVMDVVRLDQLAIVGGARPDFWHGYLGEAA